MKPLSRDEADAAYRMALENARVISADQATRLVRAAEDLVTMFEDADKAVLGDFAAFAQTPSFHKWNRVMTSLAEVQASWKQREEG